MHRATRLSLSVAVLVAGGPSACDGRSTASGPAAAPAATATVATDPGPATPPTHWQCGETGVASRSVGPGTVHLFVSGRLLVLRHGGSAAGNRVATDAEGNRFESGGDATRLTLSGEPGNACTPAARPSPWFEAAARGVLLRGVGNEPGWIVELRPGSPPTLFATLDYGERTLELPLTADTRAGSSAPAWSATAPGMHVRLTATPGPCRDGMSGVLHEARVELAVDDRRYAGCGAFLDDFAAFME